MRGVHHPPFSNHQPPTFAHSAPNLRLHLDATRARSYSVVVAPRITCSRCARGGAARGGDTSPRIAESAPPIRRVVHPTTCRSSLLVTRARRASSTPRRDAHCAGVAGGSRRPSPSGRRGRRPQRPLPHRPRDARGRAGAPAVCTAPHPASHPASRHASHDAPHDASHDAPYDARHDGWRHAMDDATHARSHQQRDDPPRGPRGVRRACTRPCTRRTTQGTRRAAAPRRSSDPRGPLPPRRRRHADG